MFGNASRAVARLVAYQPALVWAAGPAAAAQQLHTLLTHDPSKPSSSSSGSSSPQKDLTFPHPCSLEYERGGLVHPIEGTALGRVVWALLGGYTQRQQLHLGAAAMYEALVEVRDDPRLATGLALDPSKLLHRLHLSWLHLWLLVGRLKGEPDPGVKRWRGYLYTDYFYKDLDRSIRAEVQIHPGKWVKTVERVLFSSGLAYDMALTGQRPDLVPGQAEIKGWLPGDPHASFVEALLRNVYEGRAGAEGWGDAARLAAYLRWQQANLEATPAEAILRGQVSFLAPLEAAGSGQAAAAAHHHQEQRQQQPAAGPGG